MLYFNHYKGQHNISVIKTTDSRKSQANKNKKKQGVKYRQPVLQQNWLNIHIQASYKYNEIVVLYS